MRKKLLIMTLALVALLGLSTVCASAASGTSGTTRTIYVNASLTESADPNFQTLDAALTYAVGTSVTEDSVEIILQSDTTMAAACSVTRNITVKSAGGTYTITNANVFTVGSGCSLTLENVNLTSTTIRTLNVTNGHLYLNDGATLTRNRVSVSGTNANFTMNGGTITGNSAGTTGGGVYLNGGTFTMHSGTITGNSAGTTGGGVYVNGGTFTMHSGIIQNCTATIGGGVYVNSGTFTMNDGTIDSNEATQAGSGGGGGVAVNNATFTMNGGKIKGNNSPMFGSGVRIGFGSGSPVFTMNGGSIIDNEGCNGVLIRNGTFNMSGAPVIKGNPDNVYFYTMSPTKTITLTGPLQPGSEVWFYSPVSANGIFATSSSVDDAAASARYFRSDDGTYAGIASGTNLVWGTVVAEIVDNGTVTGSYLTLNEAITAYTDHTTQMIQLKENITVHSTVDKDVCLNLNGKNITGGLTVEGGCTLNGLDSATDAYKTATYGKISTISGDGTVAPYTDTEKAHTTKEKHYLTVKEDDGTSFHRYNVQVSDYYFRLVYGDGTDTSTDAAIMNFTSAVQGDSHVADAIASLQMSSSTTGQAETNTITQASALTGLKSTLSAGNPFRHGSHFITVGNPYTAQYALKATLNITLSNGQTATLTSIKDRTLKDVLGYFYKASGTTQEQKNAIDVFLARHGLGAMS